jgi:NAD(P)-dependent dehydrogenase (short-subunit alcohol dehydrogenase family)
MAGKLQGKIAIVTGGTSGIGLATARHFAAEGARVMITGRRQTGLDAAVAAIPNAIGISVDSANLSDLDRLFARVAQDMGRIDILFVNAGGGSLLPLGQITLEQYEDTFGRNVKGVLFTVQKALPFLAAGASVILVGSTAGSSGLPAFSVYAASKAAVRSFARSWIVDLKGRDVRVNALSPGSTITPGLLALAGPDSARQQAMLDDFAAQIPLGRVADPDDVAKVAVFLASDESSFVNGIELFVDGGQAQI